MDDLISRQEAIDVVEKSRRLNHHQDGKVASNHEYEHRHFLKILRDLPPAYPKKGKWKILKIWEYELANGGKMYVPEYQCECCLHCYESYVRGDKPIMPEDADFPNFCENCGADMRESE
jgi:hypothetical protein